MLPIVIRSTEEMLRLVPDDLREASYALGTASGARSSPWCCRPPSPASVSGVLLAVARAAGETAPLLFTIGARHARSTGTCSTGPNTALSVQIFSNAQQPFAAAQDRAWGAALTLIVIDVPPHSSSPASWRPGSTRKQA